MEEQPIQEIEAQTINPEKKPDPMENSQPPKNIKNKKIIALVILIFLVVIAVFGYLIAQNYLPKREETTYSQPEATPTSSESTFANLITDTNYENEEINRMLDALVTSKNLEFSESMKIVMAEGCIGTGESKNIIQGDNQYSLSETRVDPESIQFCSMDLQGTFIETYWIDGEIYYRQYSNKDFQIAEPNSNIAIPAKPTEYLPQILPLSETVEVITSSENEITISGKNAQISEGNYVIEISEVDTIKKIVYDLKIEEDAGEMQGIIDFKVYTGSIVPPITL